MPTPNANSIAFGNAVRQARVNKHLKQQTLAEAADLAHSYVSNIENGKRNPSLATIVKLTRVLDTTPAELLHAMDVIRRAQAPKRAPQAKAQDK